METEALLSLVGQLEEDIEDLEDNLEPLLTAAFSATTKKLPVLDRTKLYVLVVYSIESLLFSYLRLNGIQAKEHPVFKELTRVKQYFEKIKQAEAGPVKPRENLSVNKEAAGRIIKHALSGNDKFDAEKAERQLREMLLAKRKLKELEMNRKEKLKAQEIVSDEPASDESGEIHDEEMADATELVDNASVQVNETPTKTRKKRKSKKQRMLEQNQK